MTASAIRNQESVAFERRHEQIWGSRLERVEAAQQGRAQFMSALALVERAVRRRQEILDAEDAPWSDRTLDSREPLGEPVEEIGMRSRRNPIERRRARKPGGSEGAFGSRERSGHCGAVMVGG